MSNNPTQDAYNPDGIGSEFEKHLFDELNVGEIFRMNPNNNEMQYRKENDTQALSLGENKLYDANNRQVVYTKI
jgi:hypothetical protein